MMAPFYELLQTLSSWLGQKGINKADAQKYITSLFVALSEDAKINSKKDLKILLKASKFIPLKIVLHLGKDTLFLMIQDGICMILFH